MFWLIVKKKFVTTFKTTHLLNIIAIFSFRTFLVLKKFVKIVKINMMREQTEMVSDLVIGYQKIRHNLYGYSPSEYSFSNTPEILSTQWNGRWSVLSLLVYKKFVTKICTTHLLLLLISSLILK